MDFKIYPDAGHGFASSKDPKVYRTEDAKDADARTDAFLAKVLKEAESQRPREASRAGQAPPLLLGSCTSRR